MYQLLFFLSLIPFSFLIFQKKWRLWNTRANGDATKENLFYTLERDWLNGKVEWISENRIALGLDLRGLDNDIEICQIDEEGETANSRVIKQFKHNVSIGISTILQLFYKFSFHLA